jgi:predicted DCC family thiol-disulfide oxidoreductase YuxK
MNALNNHVIIYDDSCPMCTWYTGQFVKAGALTQDGRVSFAEMGGLQQHLDLDKARHQIPLIDTATGTTRYGLEAIFLILTNIFPTLSGVLSSRFVHRLIEPLYKFISLNRRVIVPCPANRKGFDASPDFDFGYRLLYLFLGTGLVYSYLPYRRIFESKQRRLLLANLVFAHGFGRCLLSAACFVGVVV